MLLDDIATYLAAQSTSLSVGAAGNLVKAINLDAPTVPNTIVALYEQAGVFNQYAMSTSTGTVSVVYESPRLQAISRSTSYQTARTNAQTVYTILDGLSKNLPTSSGTRYLSVEAVQAPFALGRDGNDRHIVSVNFDVTKEIG